MVYWATGDELPDSLLDFAAAPLSGSMRIDAAYVRAGLCTVALLA